MLLIFLTFSQNFDLTLDIFIKKKMYDVFCFFFFNYMFTLLVQVGCRLIPCHKLVLACVIPYFRYCFSYRPSFKTVPV